MVDEESGAVSVNLSYAAVKGAGIIAFMLLYGLMQTIRLSLGDPLWGTSWTYNLGDPVVSFVYFAAVASALRDFPSCYREEDEKRWYMRTRWFVTLAVLFAILNMVSEVNNVVHGFPLRREFSPPQLVHFLLMPLYSAAVVGVLPYLFMNIKGRTGSKVIAVLALFIYVGALIFDLVQGKSLA